VDAVSQPGPVLTVIGLWSDRAEPYWPDPKDFVDEQWNEIERAEVVRALRSGRQVRQFRGESTCRMCGQLNGASEVTDGTYLWPDGLAHYVSEHSVRLPEQVEAHFLRQKARTGVLSEPTDDSVQAKDPNILLEADESWWLSLGSADWD
jgi:hypothetical protein